MKKHYGALALALGLALAASAAQAAPVVGSFTGSADDAGLDLAGNFDYALTMNPFANGLRVGDATFTHAAATAGVSLMHQNFNQSWYNPTYTGTAADLRLGQVMNSVIWSMASEGQSLGMTLDGLVVGNTYKVQLLFGEGCCSRGFNIFQDGDLLVEAFSPSALSGIASGARSAFVSNTFTATATSLNVSFGGFVREYGDNNPILSAATLEALEAAPAQVPEPASLGMLAAGLGLMQLLRRKHRKA